MRNFFLYFLLLALASCASYRPSGDHKISNISGVRTMRTFSWTGSMGVKASIEAARKECEAEGKMYSHVSHNNRDMGTVNYRCE